MMLDQVGQMAVYTVKAGGSNALVAVKQIMIVLLGIEAGGAGDGRDAYWLQLQAIKHDDSRLVATVLIDDPLLTPEHTANTRIMRYIYQEGDLQPIEYVNAIRGGAVTSEFGLLENFFPVFEADGLKETLFPESGRYLGLDIEKTETRNTDATVPTHVLRLELDPELLIGTGRNAREVEGKRIWTGDDYQYRRFEQADYDEMIEAGINYFRVDLKQEQWVWRRPVFYLANHVDQYPEMFYRANCRGMTMFMDEPAIHQAWYFQAHPEVAVALKGPAGAARMLEARVKESYKKGNYGSNRLFGLLRRKYDMGDLVIEEDHYPAWETMEWSAYYQMKAGLPGVVHECRYTDKADVNVLNAEFDARIPDETVNIFKIKNAFFRGAARIFEGDWGIAIYGQSEQSISPLAVTTAYDMGARNVWYWTSDRLHHLPYAEQLQLTRHLRAHQKKHSRKPLSELRQVAHTAIVMPDGYIMSTYSMYAVSVFHYDRCNEHGLKYRDVLHPAALQVERCIKRNIPFDIVYNDGTPGWQEYDEAIVIDEKGVARWYKKGKLIGDPPLPPRTAEEDSPKPPTIHIRVERDKENPLTIKFVADIDNDGKPAGLRTRDWGTPNWKTIEAVWHVFENPDYPAFATGGSLEHTFAKPGSYRVSAWTCGEHGTVARDELFVVIP